jgi:hypothetical protein
VADIDADAHESTGEGSRSWGSGGGDADFVGVRRGRGPEVSEGRPWLGAAREVSGNTGVHGEVEASGAMRSGRVTALFISLETVAECYRDPAGRLRCRRDDANLGESGGREERFGVHDLLGSGVGVVRGDEGGDHAVERRLRCAGAGSDGRLGKRGWSRGIKTAPTASTARTTA